MTPRLLPFAALMALMLMAMVQSTTGAPIPGVQVGLEHQTTGQTMTATTGGPNAEAVFTAPPGAWFVFVANGSTLPGPAQVTVLQGAQQRTSGLLSPVAGRVHAPDPQAPARLLINAGPGAPVRVRLTRWQPATSAAPACLTLPNGSPRFVTAQGSANGTGGGAYGAAMTAARAEWSRLARVHNAPGQPDYSDWGRAARTNVSSSVRSGLPPVTTVFLVGQPCRRP